MSSMLLVAAVLVSLASGVLVAYSVCVGFFWAVRRHAAGSARAAVGRVSVAVEG